MPALNVITDAPQEVTLADNSATSQVQIAKTGVFKDPRYGTFKITLADFNKWIANFQMLNRDGGREGLPIDIDHAPEKRGDTEAAGWVKRVTIRGSELWASVEWNSLGMQLISDKRYKYLSPSFVGNYKDESGKEYGSALLGVALTNRPFLSMATVNLSAAAFADEVEEDTRAYSQSVMPELTKIRQALKLPDDADEATILAKVAELEEPATTPVSLEDQAKAEGKFILSADQFASLSQQASEGSAAAKQLTKMTFDTKYDKLLSEGKVLPAQRELYEKMYEADATSTVALLDSLQPVVNISPVGAGGGSDDAGVDGALARSIKKEADGFLLDGDRNKLHERALKLSAERSIDYGEAVIAAAEEMGVS